MAYFRGQWKLNSGVSVSGSYSCTVDFTAGGEVFKCISLNYGIVSYINGNGDYERPDEEYGTDIIDFGEGVLSTSIDTGFCKAFKDRCSPYSENAVILGIEPTISVVGNYLTIHRVNRADDYKLYINGKYTHWDQEELDVANSIDLTVYDLDENYSYNINVTAIYNDDVFDSEGKAISFESAMSNTEVLSFASNPEEPDEPDVPTDPEEPDEPDVPTDPEEPDESDVPSKPVEVTEYLIKKETLTDIANAIRERRGFTYPITAEAFASEIRSIESETSSPTCIDLAATENGQYLPEEFGADYFSEVTVNVEGGNSNATTTALDFTNYANGSFTETLSNGLVLTHTVVFDGGTPTAVDNIKVSGV